MNNKKKYIITVTRQFGSLGRPIAKKLAELLDIEYYDRDIIDEAAKKLNLPVSVVQEEEEVGQLKDVSGFARMVFPLGKSIRDKQDQIFEAQKNIINFLADQGSCVIVGRCSDFILEPYDNVTNIYIYAPYAARIENCVNNLGMELDHAKKMIVAVDEARKAYHLQYAGYEPDDISHKDLLIDSSYLGVDGTAEYLADLIRKKYEL